MKTESENSMDLISKDDIYFNVKTDDLLIMLEDLLQKNEKMKYENLMLENFQDRINKLRALNESKSRDSIQIERVNSQNRVNKIRSRSRSTVGDRLLKLSGEQMCQVAEEEIEECRQEIESRKVNSDKMSDLYKAVMEAADIRLSEIIKFRYEFDRDVVKGGVNPYSNIVMSEKFMRHFEERLRQRDTLIDKLRLKNSTLLQQKCKLKMQLKQKDEMGEVLQEVDFQQLKIENKQYLDKMEERNDDLIQLKLISGHTVQRLNIYKQKLATVMDELKKLNNEINIRQEKFEKAELESVVVKKEKDKFEVINHKLMKHLTDYRVPPVMDFVHCVANKYDLTRQEKILTRKLDIAKMALNRHKRIWNDARRNDSTF